MENSGKWALTSARLADTSFLPPLPPQVVSPQGQNEQQSNLGLSIWARLIQEARPEPGSAQRAR